MKNAVLPLTHIAAVIKPVADKYHISEIYLFGSYARQEATENSDIDLLVYGGANFMLTDIFSFAEEIRHILERDVDVFEINEINTNSDFYKSIMKERVKVA